MLSRRHLRAKTLQALYAFFQSGDFEVAKSERELFRTIDKVYDLYISQLFIFREIKGVAERFNEDNKQKHITTHEDLNPNLKFINNRLLNQLCENSRLKYLAESRKISFQTEGELMRRLFANIRNSEEYKTYMESPESSYKQDQEFLINAFCNFIAEDELLVHYYEEQSIHWQEDFYFVNTMVIRTLKDFKENTTADHSLMDSYKDPVDDKSFVADLFRKTIVNAQKYEEMIMTKTKNWEAERIAFMDMILMKMAICELTNFSSIPVKVTLNEYIELSKEYSTEKSKIFINGILDKLVIDLKRDNLLNKVGRGLVE